MDAVLAIIKAKEAAKGGKLSKADVLDIVEAEAEAVRRLTVDATSSEEEEGEEIQLERKKMQ